MLLGVINNQFLTIYSVIVSMASIKGTEIKKTDTTFNPVLALQIVYNESNALTRH